MLGTRCAIVESNTLIGCGQTVTFSVSFCSLIYFIPCNPTDDDSFLITTASGVTMDRFDGRLLSLCQSVIGQSDQQIALSDEENADEDLNLERYRDMQDNEDSEKGDYQRDLFQCGNVSDRCVEKAERTDGVVKYASNVEKNWYRYPNPRDASYNESPINALDESFSLPSQLPSCPDDMIVPRNQRIFDLIMHTAKKTRTQHQLEVLIKVKQGDNINFDFLREDSCLNPFYEYIKGLSDRTFWSALLGRDVEICVDGPNIVSEKAVTSALSILGETYISDSDEEDDRKIDAIKVDVDNNKEKNIVECVDFYSKHDHVGNEHIDGEVTKLDRLERTRRLKGYFSKEIQSLKNISNEGLNDEDIPNQVEERGERKNQDNNKRNLNYETKRSCKLKRKLYIEGKAIKHAVDKKMLIYVDSYVTTWAIYCGVKQ